MERVRAVLETEAVVGRSALEYRGLIASALMADEAQPSEPRPSYEQLADRLDQEAARRTKAAWSPQEATTAREWGNVADFVRALGREQQPAASTQDGTATALLATPCDACDHTLNWHRNDAGCTVPRCVCGRFQQPDEEPSC